MSPIKFISLFMLIIYICVGMYLFAKLRNLDISSIAKTFIRTENSRKNNNPDEKKSPKISEERSKKLVQRYVDTLTKELEYDSKTTSLAERTPSKKRSTKEAAFSEFMNLDGRLCMAPSIEPYFARR